MHPRFLLFLVSSITLAACSEDGLELSVDLKTDYVAGVEFDAVRVELAGEDSSPNRWESSEEIEADRRASYVRGVRVAERVFDSAETVRVRVSLLDVRGAPIARRTTILEMRRSFALAVILTRDCSDVVCPRDARRDDATECLGGVCVVPTCTPDEPMSCPTPECSVDEDCSGSVACAIGRCIEGVCLSEPEDTRCGRDERCRVDVGCVPETGELDAGTDAAIDAGTEADAATDTGAPTDAGTDAGADSGTDAGTDAGADAGSPTCTPIPSELALADDTMGSVSSDPRLLDVAWAGTFAGLFAAVDQGPTANLKLMAIEHRPGSGVIHQWAPVEDGLASLSFAWCSSANMFAGSALGVGLHLFSLPPMGGAGGGLTISGFDIFGGGRAGASPTRALIAWRSLRSFTPSAGVTPAEGTLPDAMTTTFSVSRPAFDGTRFQIAYIARPSTGAPRMRVAQVAETSATVLDFNDLSAGGDGDNPSAPSIASNESESLVAWMRADSRPMAQLVALDGAPLDTAFEIDPLEGRTTLASGGTEVHWTGADFLVLRGCLTSGGLRALCVTTVDPADESQSTRPLLLCNQARSQRIASAWTGTQLVLAWVGSGGLRVAYVTP